jgi:hypothetical protein
MAKDDDDILDAPEPLNAAVHRYWRRLGSSDLALKLISRGLQDGHFIGLRDGEPQPTKYWQQVQLGIQLVDLSLCTVVTKDGIEERGTFQICKRRENPSSESSEPKPKRHKRPQRDFCETVAWELWAPDGKPPEEMSDPDVIDKLGDEVRKRRKEKKITDVAEPSPTTLLRAAGRRPDPD